jgi:hypothetical protein
MPTGAGSRVPFPTTFARKRRLVLITWLKRLFGGLDRTEAASECAAAAMEGIATLLEEAHAALLGRRWG